MQNLLDSYVDIKSQLKTAIDCALKASNEAVTSCKINAECNCDYRDGNAVYPLSFRVTYGYRRFRLTRYDHAKRLDCDSKNTVLSSCVAKELIGLNDTIFTGNLMRVTELLEYAIHPIVGTVPVIRVHFSSDSRAIKNDTYPFQFYANFNSCNVTLFHDDKSGLWKCNGVQSEIIQRIAFAVNYAFPPKAWPRHYPALS